MEIVGKVLWSLICGCIERYLVASGFRQVQLGGLGASFGFRVAQLADSGAGSGLRWLIRFGSAEST
jgi:hypothetical protein